MVMRMGMGTRIVETGWGWGQEPRGLLGMGTNSCPRAAVWYGVVYPASVTAYTYTLVLTTSTVTRWSFDSLFVIVAVSRVVHTMFYVL